MRNCPVCGHENSETDRFCSNCGANLAVDSPEPPTPIESPPDPAPGNFPPPVDFSVPAGASVEEEWRMSSLGPPPARKRPVWLWVIIILIGLCLLGCVALIGFSLTETGQDWIEDLERQATEQAD